jgi:hypothetical protein
MTAVVGGFGGTCCISTVGVGYDRGIEDEVGGKDGGPRGAILVYTAPVSLEA